MTSQLISLYSLKKKKKPYISIILALRYFLTFPLVIVNSASPSIISHSNLFFLQPFLYCFKFSFKFLIAPFVSLPSIHSIYVSNVMLMAEKFPKLSVSDIMLPSYHIQINLCLFTTNII